MTTPSNLFNRWGASVDKFLSMFPTGGLRTIQACDFGSENAILDAQSDAAAHIISLLKPDTKNALISPKYQVVVRPGEATDGQTTWTIPFTPIVANSIHMWRRPNYSGFYNPSYHGYYDQSFWSYSGEPILGQGEIPTTDYTINLSTGAVVYTGGTPLTTCEQVIASYRVDVNSAAYENAHLAGVVNIMAAVRLGSKLFAPTDPMYGLIERYYKMVYDPRVGYIDQMIMGIFMPSDTIYEKYFYESERNSKTAFSVKRTRT